MVVDLLVALVGQFQLNGVFFHGMSGRTPRTREGTWGRTWHPRGPRTPSLITVGLAACVCWSAGRENCGQLPHVVKFLAKRHETLSLVL